MCSPSSTRSDWPATWSGPPLTRRCSDCSAIWCGRPGGYLVTAFKAGDSTLRRGGLSTGLGIAFDIYWLAPSEMERLVTGAGFTPVFWAGRPAEETEPQPQGYLVARRH